MSPSCRTCGSDHTRFVGRSPRARWFAGARLQTALYGGALYRCAQCDLLQRSPILSDADYVKLYESSGDHWQQDTLRPDQQRVRAYILGSLPQGGRVLDIGCAAGALLASLGSHFEKFGVEPAAEAAAKATSKGVTILADAFSSLPQQHRGFDLICAVDVIEHVADPLSFLRQLLGHLAPGGEIVVSTGNAATPIWQCVGPAYYYSHCFEHVSFISPKWCAFIRSQAIEHKFIERSFRHEVAHQSRHDMKRWLKFTLKLALSWLERCTVMQLPGTARRLGPRLMVGEPGLFPDHMLVAFTAVGSHAGHTPTAHER
jgi:2-polyprenyl-3-methyl-5-hydroxy-6-metoxy-1,4-benzoquinol methylase